MKLLVVTSEPVNAEAVREALGTDEDLAKAEVMVIAPALHGSKVKFWVSDDDDAIERAEEVQEETVAQLGEDGMDAAGDTGESDPAQAIRDTLAAYGADRIVVFAHPEADEAYREDNLRGEDFGVPLDFREVSKT
ncbi:MAG: hypothetical protein H0V29_08850 [Thermoleophilaceae bacterium]|nr:hypothetical protein [Thermoleophilaceae bacterium]